MAERGEIREARIRDGGTVEMKAAEILHRLDGRQPSVRHSRFTEIEPIECGRDGSQRGHLGVAKLVELQPRVGGEPWTVGGKRADRKSTRLNSSHGYISYAVFCLKK